MKPIYFILLFLGINTAAHAQSTIQFEHDLTWNQLLQQAKATHQYIFMDCYATWCHPCRYMNDSIFSRPEVIAYLNAHFINVQVQMDRTKHDNDHIKQWYAAADSINRQYAVDAFPTFLFISPDGVLINRGTGAYTDPDAFIAKAAKALDPDEQYFFLLEQYNRGQRDEIFLQHLIQAAENAKDAAMLQELERYSRH